MGPCLIVVEQGQMGTSAGTPARDPQEQSHSFEEVGMIEVSLADPVTVVGHNVVEQLLEQAVFVVG